MIARMTLPRLDRTTALLAAIGALGALLVLLRVAPHGPGAGADAAWSILVARTLLAGDGFVAYSVQANQGPFFPLALAGVGLFGPDPLDAAGWLNAAAFGLTVFVTAVWVRSRAQSRSLAVWAGFACALSLPLAATASWAMTDPLFILWTTLSLFALDRFLDGRGRPLLLAAAICAALACATRYLGLALVAGALPLLLAQRRGVAPPARARDASIFAAVALTPFGAWMLFNLAAAGSLTDRYFPSGWHGLATLHRMTGELARWTLGEGGYARLRAIAEALPGGAPGHDGASVTGVLLQAAVPLAAAACAAAALAFLRRRGAAPGGLLVPAAFAAVYAAVTVFVNWRLDMRLPERHLAPLYPPLLVAAAIVLGGLLREASRRGASVRLPLPSRFGGTATASLPALGLAAALTLWLPQQALAGYDDVRSWRAEGRGATGAAWDGSTLVRWLRAHPTEGPIWTNLPYVLYLAADLRTDYPYPLLLLPEDAEGWIAEARAGREARVVWVHQHRPAIGDAADAAALPGLELEALLDDGAVFRATADPAARGLSLAAAALDGARPLAESAWDLRLGEAGRRLVYVRDGCSRSDTGEFFLHVWPSDPADLPAGRRGRGFEDIRFSYPRHGFVEDGRCVVTRDLPPYPVAELRTGQDGAAGGEAWAARVALAPDAAIDLDALRARAEPLVAAPFEVYRDGGRLVYVREACAPADIGARFFLHAVPLDPADLPEERRESGFDNLDFAFGEYGALTDGRCVAARPLPAYRIASIRTGQWGDAGELWSAEAAFGE